MRSRKSRQLARRRFEQLLGTLGMLGRACTWIYLWLKQRGNLLPFLDGLLGTAYGYTGSIAPSASREVSVPKLSRRDAKHGLTTAQHKGWWPRLRQSS